MKITFFGAAQNVTGSKHLLEFSGSRVLLDCGLYQGKREEAYGRNKALPFDAATIGATILSHAHADHCGALPILVKNGYEGKIFATPSTAEIARLIMMDSAKLQRNDYHYLLEKGIPAEKLLPPLYEDTDVEEACRHFETVPYARVAKSWKKISPDCRFKFYDAGHILGSAVTVIKCREKRGGEKTIAYTGDLGNHPVPIMPAPETLAEPAETLISECTYGNRLHGPIDEAYGIFESLVSEAARERKKIIVPAFALGRTQEIIYILHKLHSQGKIPGIPIYLDSPLAREITAVFARYPQNYDQETKADFPGPPFSFGNLRQVVTAQESRALAKKKGPFIIIASSGMSEGGRVLYHLESSLSDKKAIILLTGFQAENTLGRRLLDGISPVNVYGRPHQVRAKIIALDQLSAHADQKGLLDYIAKIKGLKRVFLVHTEIPQAEAFRKILQKRLPSLEITVPETGDKFEI